MPLQSPLFKQIKMFIKSSAIILFTVFSCLAFTAKSQFIKGQKLLGGSANIIFSSGKSESVGNPTNKNPSFYLGISPRFSWVTKENQMMGVVLGAGYFYSKSFSQGSQDYQTGNSFTLGAGYFFRQYKSFSPQTGWFIEYNISGGYGRSTNKLLNMGVETKNKEKNYSAGVLVYPGFYYRLSPRTLIEASFGGLNAVYSKSKGQTSANDRFTVAASFPTNLTLGVQFFLGNKPSK